MGEGVIDAVLGELTGNLLRGTAGAVALGVTALNHKVFNNTVEGQAVIKAFANKLLEVGNGNGSACGVELNDDIAVVLFALIVGVRNVELDVVGGGFRYRIAVLSAKS